MCQSIMKKETCKFGKKCNFAHDIKQLIIKQCSFGDKCRLTVYKHGKIVNKVPNVLKKGVIVKKCTYIHENEEREDYFKRLEN